jgi:hypothetical protein
MRIDLLPKQAEIYNPPKEAVNVDIALYQGGFGSGKTFIGSVLGLISCQKNEGSTWLVASDTLARLKLTTIETYLELLYDWGLTKGSDYEYSKSDSIIRLKCFNNSRIIFKGLDDVYALRSINAIGGHIEEASRVSYAAYKEFLSRLRQAGSDNVIRCILTTNPESIKGWMHKEFSENLGISVETVRGTTIKTSRRKVVAATMENVHVSDGFIAMLRSSYDEKTWRTNVLGEDADMTEGLINYNFSDSNLFETAYDPSKPLYLTCDFNVDPNCWEIAQRHGGIWHFIDEICFGPTDTFKCIAEFLSRYKGHRAGIVVCGDPAGGARSTQNTNEGTNYTIILNALYEAGFSKDMVKFHVKKKHSLIIDRYNAWTSKLRSIDGVSGILMHPTKCKWLVYNMQNARYIPGTSVAWTPSKSDVEKDNSLKYLIHPMDAAQYLVEYYEPVTKTGIEIAKTNIYSKPYRPQVKF